MFPDLVHGFSWFVCSLKNQSIEGLKLCLILDVMKPKESTWMGPRLGRADVPTTSGRFLCLVHTTAFWTVGPCTNPIFYTDPCLFTWTITQQKWRYNVQEIFVLVMFKIPHKGHLPNPVGIFAITVHWTLPIFRVELFWTCRCCWRWNFRITDLPTNIRYGPQGMNISKQS